MARIRTIKPEFWEDEKLAEISLSARLLFIGTWNFADDYGVFPNSTKWIKAKIFPYDTIRESDIQGWLDTLVKFRFLVRFAESGKSYYVVRNFKSHQLTDKRYTRSILPDGFNLSEILEKSGVSEITVVSQCNTNDTTPQEMESIGKGKVEEKEGIEGRKQKFASTLEPYLEVYGRGMLNAFYKYWTEHGENDRKFRREKEKSWDLKRRLETWKENESKFSNKQNGREQNNNELKNLLTKLH